MSSSEQEPINLDDESDEEDDDVPDVATAQRLVEQFAQITGTDEACAQFYLQDRKWDLERSVNAFLEAASGGGGVKVLNDGDEPELVVTFDSKMVSALGEMSGEMSLEPPKDFRVITWNIDGLDEKNLKKRTKAVAAIIQTERADIVLLQEVVPVTLTYLRDLLPQFAFVVGDSCDYFTATLLRRTTVYFDSHTIIPFPNTLMGRNLVSVQAHIGDVKLHLLNSHLESTAEHSQERMSQLRTGFSKLTASPPGTTALFAGDLNLRDKEVGDGLPKGVLDLWEACGQRPECKFTWDTVRNTNKQIPSKYKPRLRFDRVYLRQSDPPMVNPEHFGLVGIQRVIGTQSFPSDHWGIIVHFKVIDKNLAKTAAGPTSTAPRPSTSTTSKRKHP